MTIYNIVDLPPITSSYVACRDGKVHIIVPASYRTINNPMGMLLGIAMLDDDERHRLNVEW